VNGDLAVLLNNDRGIAFVDISDPARPIRLSDYPATFFVFRIAFHGTLAYVSNDGPPGPGGYLEILDLRDPTAPVQVGLFESRAPTTMAMIGDHAFVSDLDDGLLVVDLSNPAHPVTIGQLSISEGAQDVRVEGSFAYVLENNRSGQPGQSGLLIIDVSDPKTPVQLSRAAIPAFAYRIASSKGFAYVAGSSGLHTYDVSDPMAPVRVGTWTGGQGGLCHDIEVVGNYAFATDRESLHVLTLNNPAAPVRVGSRNPPGLAYGPEVVGNHAYLSGSALQILQLSPVPTLNINPVPGPLRLHWPSTSTAWVLEQTDQLESTTGWTLVPPPYERDASGFFYTSPISAERAFFRLRRP